MDKYKIAQHNIRKEYLIKRNELLYWEKIEKQFKKYKAKNKEAFVMEFSHNIFADFCADNESKIDSIAKLYGYEIVDERLMSTKSIYTFKIISK